MNMSDRRDWMGLLARSPSARLEALVGALPDHTFARPPEIGTVMVRGRAGGTGSPFNLGEVTVTRCTLRLPSGTIGHAWVQGRNKTHATRAAIVDALMQDDPETTRIQILAPLAAEAEARNTTRRAKAAATKVEFFTLVRGED